MNHLSRFEREKIAKLKTEMDEAQFLSSASYRNYLERLSRATTGKQDLRVAFANRVETDGKIIWVNPMHPLLNSKSIAEKTLFILGMIAHEAFHILYTDFQTLQALARRYERESKFRAWVVKQLFNIVEDAAIELIGTNYYEGTLRSAIFALNSVAYEKLPTIEELEAEGTPRLSQFLMLCSYYLVGGKIKGKIADSELRSAFVKAMPILEEGRAGLTSWDRLNSAEWLYRIALPFVEEAEAAQQEEEAKAQYAYTKNQELSSGGANAKPREVSQRMSDPFAEIRERAKKEIEEEHEAQQENGLEEQQARGGEGKKESKTGNDAAENSADNEGGNECSKESNESTFEEATGCKESPGKTEGTAEISESFGGEKKNDNAEEYSHGTPKDSERAEAGAGSNAAIREQDDSADAKDTSQDRREEAKGNHLQAKYPEGRIAGEDVEQAEKFIENKVRETLRGIAEQLDAVKGEAAKEELDREYQRERDNAIREFAKTVKLDWTHRHISIQVVRDFTIDDSVREAYDETFKEIKTYAHVLVQNLRRSLRLNEDEKRSGEYEGKVDQSRLYRTDGRIFYKRKEKSDEADLALLVLVDESGSMGSGSRIKYARLACMVLYEVSQKLHIPMAVIGHWAVHGQNIVRHLHLVDFDSRDANEKYKLLGIDAYENTREGVSLAYAGEYLLKRPEKDKILIAISDGEPFHLSKNDIYSGRVSQNDTGRVVKKLEAKGINVIGVAIGEGKSAIRDIYTKNFIDIQDLSALPRKLAEIIKGSLLKRE